ncbi:hypothetical protein KEJ50_00565 [Candidatus Bathyarchaeota archaeon]|nr:hypothetical protein [Candidatus Bathyarchaeota archaeon]
MKFLKTLTFLTLLLAFLIYSVLTQGLLSASSLLIIFNIPVLWLILFKKNKFKTILPKAAIISVMLSLIILSNFKPAYPYIISEVSLPQIQYGVESRPLNIIVGEGGNLYFTEQYGGKIGQLNPLSNEITEWSIPSNLLTSEPWDLNYISGGEIFFTDYRQNKIIKLTLSNQITQWDIPTPNSGPRGIFAKSSNEIWFTEFLAGKIAKLNIASSPNKFYEYSLPSGSQPNDIVVVSDKVWVTDFGRDKITCLDSTTGEIIEYSLPTGSKPYGITLDPNGMIWFTLYGRNMIGKLNPWNREVTEYKPIPTANSQPTGITIDDATGNIWFTESAGHKIGKYVPGENMFYEYPTLTSSSTPMGITLYRDSNNKLYVWFTEWAANKLGEIIEGENTGPTTTITTSQLTTVATGKYSVATSKTTLTSSEGGDTPSPNPILPNEYSVETTTTTLTNTAFKLSTSTMATSMNYITEVMHTSVTVTSTSTTYVSTISLTTTTTSTSYSTSYTGTSSITYTTTLHETVYTSTMSLTSSTTQTLPSTLKTTVWFTSYKSTIPTTFLQLIKAQFTLQMFILFIQPPP